MTKSITVGQVNERNLMCSFHATSNVYCMPFHYVDTERYSATINDCSDQGIVRTTRLTCFIGALWFTIFELIQLNPEHPIEIVLFLMGQQQPPPFFRRPLSAARTPRLSSFERTGPCFYRTPNGPSFELTNPERTDMHIK